MANQEKTKFLPEVPEIEGLIDDEDKALSVAHAVKELRDKMSADGYDANHYTNFTDKYRIEALENWAAFMHDLPNVDPEFTPEDAIDLYSNLWALEGLVENISRLEDQIEYADESGDDSEVLTNLNDIPRLVYGAWHDYQILDGDEYRTIMENLARKKDPSYIIRPNKHLSFIDVVTLKNTANNDDYEQYLRALPGIIEGIAKSVQEEQQVELLQKLGLYQEGQTEE